MSTSTAIPAAAKLLNAALSNAPMAAFITDDQTVLFANEKMRALLQMNPRQVSGLDDVLRLYFDPNGPARRVGNGTNEDLPAAFETCLTLKDGRKLWLENQRRQIDLDGCPVAIYWVTDITGYKFGGAPNRDFLSRQYTEERDRQKFDDVLNASPIAISVIDGEVNPVFLNDRYAEIFGVTKAVMIGANPLTSSVDPKEGRRMVAEFDRDKMITDFEIQLRRDDGSTFWALVSLRPTKYRGARAVIVWIYNITARKQLEEETRRNQELLDLIFETAPMLLTISRVSDDTYIRVNQATADFHGLTISEVMRHKVTEIYIDPADRFKLLQMLQENPGPPVHTEAQVRRLGNGEAVWCIVSAVPFSYFGEAAILEGGIDISERKLIEHELAVKEAQLRATFDNMPSSVLMLDRDRRIIVANDLVAKFFEVPAGLLQPGRPVRDATLAWASQSIYGPGDPEVLTDIIINNIFQQVALGGVASSEDISPSGRVLGSRWAATPDGGVVMVATDITEVKEAEKNLRDVMAAIDAANRSLEQRVKTRTRELHAAMEQAKSASLEKTEFLANMSHELRTPLNAVIGFSEMIAAAMFGPLEPKYIEYAQDISHSGQHLLAIISDILDISKVEAGAFDIDGKILILSEAADDCVAMLRVRAEKAGISLTSNVSPTLPPVLADPLRLKQVLLNLIGNALKFTPERGTITISGSLECSGGVSLAIADTGIGIAKEDLPRVLEKFGQARWGHLQSHDGTGLGLPLSKSLMQLHGGDLQIKSELSKGTVVTISFPPERTQARS